MRAQLTLASLTGNKLRPIHAQLTQQLRQETLPSEWLVRAAHSSSGDLTAQRLAWVKLLSNPDVKIRRSALTALSLSGNPEEDILQAIVPLLADPDSQLGPLVLQVLTDTPSALPFVRAALKDPRSEAGALRCLEKFGPVAHSAVPQLVERYRQLAAQKNLKPEEDHRRAILSALGAIGPGAREAVPELLAVASGTSDLRFAALATLVQIGAPPERILPLLRKALPRSNLSAIRDTADGKHVIRDAANGLASFGSLARPAVPDLLEALERVDRELDRFAPVSDQVIDLMFMSGNPGAKLQKDSFLEARQALLRALVTIDPPSVVEQLFPLMLAGESPLLDDLVKNLPGYPDRSANVLSQPSDRLDLTVSLQQLFLYLWPPMAPGREAHRTAVSQVVLSMAGWTPTAKADLLPAVERIVRAADTHLGEPVVQWLAQIAQTAPMETRLAALNLLATHSATDPAARIALLNALGNPERSIRDAAARGLIVAGEPAVGELRGKLIDPSPAVRASAASILGKMHVEEMEVRRNLIRLADDQDSLVRREAVWALGQANRPDLVGFFVKAAKDPSPQVREVAALSLAGYVSERDALRALATLLRDQSAPVTCAAANSLARSRELAIPAAGNIFDTLKTSKDSETCYWALMALANLPDTETDLADWWTVALMNPSSRVRNESLTRLAKRSVWPENVTKPDRSTIVLLGQVATSNPDSQTDANALKVLQLLGPEASPALPVLRQLLEDPKQSEQLLGILGVLEAIGPAALESAPELIDLLMNPAGKDARTEESIYRVFIALGESGKALVPQVVRDLRAAQLTMDQRPDGRVRVRRLMTLLGVVGKRQTDAMAELVGFLDSPDPDLRRESAFALGKSGDAAQARRPRAPALSRGQGSRHQALRRIRPLARYPRARSRGHGADRVEPPASA